jgi:hypothetical protein
MKPYQLTFLLLILLLSPVFGDEENYDFDVSKTKKVFQIFGYLEQAQAFLNLDRNSALFKLSPFNKSGGNLFFNNNLRLNLESKYQKGILKGYARVMANLETSSLDSNGDFSLYEAYASVIPSASFSLDAGKKRMRWGKGYAWNPVAFLDYPKDPQDPELPLKGITVLTADFTRSFKGKLQTMTFTPVLVPAANNVNARFGKPGHLYAAGKLYLLLYDTDLDLIFSATGNGSSKFGFDFSRNLAPELAIHGEFAWVNDFSRRVADASGKVTTQKFNARNFLLGLRYQTRYDTTFISEYYHNGAGYSNEEMQNFFSFAGRAFKVQQATGNGIPLLQAAQLQNTDYGYVNPMRDYFYLRITKKDPYNLVYFTPAITSIYDISDRSFSLAPEVSYNPVTNLEFRLKTIFSVGPSLTEFGERPANARTELRIRYYF